MNLTPVREFQLPAEKHAFSANVTLGEGRRGFVFLASASWQDPGEELFHLPSDRLYIYCFDATGELLWEKRLGVGVLPGIWFCPLAAMDMDGDGKDEIYFVNNRSDAPFSLFQRRLEALDPLTGETLGSWPWPDRTRELSVSKCYRFYLTGGYANGSPVLIASQGCYTDMYLQGWGKGMVKLWEKFIPETAPGPRASHLTPVMDLNGDGIDEIFWGERVLSVLTGEELMDFAPEFHGHSDLLVPFLDYATGEMYVYTCREDHESPGQKRINVFNADGSLRWGAADTGHMHCGWVATALDGFGKLAMAEHHEWQPNTGDSSDSGMTMHTFEKYFFNAVTGEPITFELPFPAGEASPIDVNGDGYSEFIYGSKVFDRFGKYLGEFRGGKVRAGRILEEYPGEQIMTLENGTVRIYADLDAEDSDIMKMRLERGFPLFLQKLTASGYNAYNALASCL
ncbi:MAG: hypothetical protein IKS78_07090 [Clostridia bacterium]|nr:hypothetical protein [Clostridia bacterium]